MIQEAMPEPQPEATANGRPKKASPPAEAKRDRSRSKDPHDEVLENEKATSTTTSRDIKRQSGERETSEEACEYTRE